SMPTYLSSQEVQIFAKAQLKTVADRHGVIAARARELKLAPLSCLFADTNWPQSYFAFVVHPVTQNLEVWNADKTGCVASPLPLVKSWLGKGKDFSWTVFIG
ncbi:MAG TPA: hypothetical protein VHA52_12945, partial [Candidatus Babeliaceae bacterium]|nr:hypothetical protein [Candidatus Babeliaceae bacterium]